MKLTTNVLLINNYNSLYCTIKFKKTSKYRVLIDTTFWSRQKNGNSR